MDGPAEPTAGLGIGLAIEPGPPPLPLLLVSPYAERKDAGVTKPATRDESLSPVYLWISNGIFILLKLQQLNYSSANRFGLNPFYSRILESQAICGFDKH